MATSSTIFGSANMELEQEFRMMALKLGQQLSKVECQNIAYVSSCMDEPAPPECDYRLYVFSTLEARGKIGPVKLDFLEQTLVHIGRKDLLNVIAEYKKKPVYKEVHSKRKLKGRMKKKKKDQTMQSAMTTDHSAYQLIYACFLTQFAEIALKMRSALESNDAAHMKYTFSTIASDGDAVARMLRKKLSIQVGINRDSSSTVSSRDSSGCTTLSEPPSPSVCELKSTPEDSLNPTPNKKSIPRSITEPQQLARSTLPMQVSSPPSSNNNVFVFSKLSASKLNLNCNSTSDDYTQSGGTGDSGFGDINHTLSEEARQQIDPDVNRGSDQDDQYREYRKGYMPLTFPTEENHPNNEYVMVKFDQP